MLRIFIAALAVMVLALAPSAWAEGPTDDAYGGQGNVLSEVTSVGSSGEPDDDAEPGSSRVSPDVTSIPEAKTAAQKLSSDSLPFTGLDLLLILGGGALLLSIGVGIRQLVREPI